MSFQIDGNKVQFWSLKKDAIAASRSIGWRANDVLPVHTRFSRGYAICIPYLGGCLSRERFKALFVARNGHNDPVAVRQFMEELNAVPKLESASTPWSAVHLLTDHRGAWIECPTSGYGFMYPTLHEAMRHWMVVVFGFERERWLARPMPVNAHLSANANGGRPGTNIEPLHTSRQRVMMGDLR